MILEFTKYEPNRGTHLRVTEDGKNPVHKVSSKDLLILTKREVLQEQVSRTPLTK
jgi:hypothetical protein